ncbi:MAG: hypothetical protein J4428_02045 [Candidatus Aenigmarchaeota archaeon]|nr:hypothetical protein [Candidatus Aenigmarchaeota archaeon]
MQIFDLENNFIHIITALFLLLPIVMATLIYAWNPDNIAFAFFMIFLEFAVIIGKFTRIDNKHVHILVALTGFFISVIEAVTFSSKYNLQNGIVSFFIYQWVWLSLYGVGLHISSKKEDLSDLMNTLVIAFGSIAAISWFWFGYIF